MNKQQKMYVVTQSSEFSSSWTIFIDKSEAEQCAMNWNNIIWTEWKVLEIYASMNPIK